MPSYARIATHLSVRFSTDIERGIEGCLRYGERELWTPFGATADFDRRTPRNAFETASVGV